MEHEIFIYIVIMSAVTLAIRILPLTLIRREIKNVTLRSFLYYVPYACLMAMTFPAVFFSTSSMLAAIAGVGVAIILALKGKGLMTVALAASITVFLVSFIPV